MPTPLLPDTVAVVRDALLGQSSISALVGTRIYDRVPAGSPTWPLLVVDTVDEAETEWHTLQGRVQLDVWGVGPSSDDEQQARLLARTIIAAIRDMRGTWASGRIVNTGLLNMLPAPDDETGRARFVIDLFVEVMP